MSINKKMRDMSLANSRLPSIEDRPCEVRVMSYPAKGHSVARIQRCPHFTACGQQHRACQDFFEWAHALRPLVRRNRTPVCARAWLANRDPETMWTFTDEGIIQIRGVEAAA